MSFTDFQSITTVGELDFLEKPSPSSPRRLPSLPRAERNSLRPLPPIPRALCCKKCKTSVTSVSHLLPLEAIPPQSRAFRGFSGKASLFTDVHHTHLSSPSVKLMATGAHTMQEITCATCTAYLGWKIVKAFELSERWKEGHFLLELENLAARIESALPRPRRQSSTDSEDSC